MDAGNSPPVITGIPDNIVIPEDTRVGDTLLDLETVTSDPDGQGLTFRLFEKDGATPAENLGGASDDGVANDKVEIAAGSSEITLKATVNYEDVDDDGETD